MTDSEYVQAAAAAIKRQIRKIVEDAIDATSPDMPAEEREKLIAKLTKRTPIYIGSGLRGEG